MASFYIPLTGLNADSTALNTIANNLSNMNTTAFKSQSTNFSDLFYQQIGSTGTGNPIQTGSGTQVASIETDFSNGSPTADGVSTHVALQGMGSLLFRMTVRRNLLATETFHWLPTAILLRVAA